MIALFHGAFWIMRYISCFYSTKDEVSLKEVNDMDLHESQQCGIHNSKASPAINRSGGLLFESSQKSRYTRSQKRPIVRALLLICGSSLHMAPRRMINHSPNGWYLRMVYGIMDLPLVGKWCGPKASCILINFGQWHQVLSVQLFPLWLLLYYVHYSHYNYYFFILGISFIIINYPWLMMTMTMTMTMMMIVIIVPYVYIYIYICIIIIIIYIYIQYMNCFFWMIR